MVDKLERQIEALRTRHHFGAASKALLRYQWQIKDYEEDFSKWLQLKVILLLCQILLSFSGTPWDNMEGDRTYGTRATSPRA